MAEPILELPEGSKSLANQLFINPSNNKIYAGKDKYFALDSLDGDPVYVGDNLSLLNNDANYIVSGTGSNQVRTNTDLDARYLQSETDPTVASWIKDITSQNISDWSSKLSNITAGSGISIDFTNPQNPVINNSLTSLTLTGHVTGTLSGNEIVTTIANSAVTTVKIADYNVTLDKLPQVTGTNWQTTGALIGWSNGTGTRNAIMISPQPYFWVSGSILGMHGFSRTLPGLVPQPGGSGTTRYLREDGSWVVPDGGGGGGGGPTDLSLGTRTATTVAIGSSTGSGMTIPEATGSLAGVISANNWGVLNGISQGTLIGRYSSGSGIAQIITIGSGLSYTGGTLSATGSSASVFTRSVDGLVPAPGGSGTTRFLREDGSWIAPSGGGGGGSVELVTAGSSTVGAVRYAGVTKTSGQWYGGVSDPTNSIRLNFDGIIHAGGLVSYGASDINLKADLLKIDNPLDKLHSLNGYKFTWKENDNYSGEDYGVIAQQVESIMPEIVKEIGGYKAIKNGNQLTALLIEAVKELSDKVRRLENEL